MDNNLEDKKRESAFNMAIKYLERLDAELLTANFCSKNMQYFPWYRTLLVLYREVSPKMTKDEKEEYKHIWPKLNTLIKEYVQRQTKDYLPSGLENILFELDMLLRKHINNHGLLMPTKSTVDELMENM